MGMYMYTHIYIYIYLSIYLSIYIYKYIPAMCCGASGPSGINISRRSTAQVTGHWRPKPGVRREDTSAAVRPRPVDGWGA